MTVYQGRFAGRTAVITGGASGLGAAAAKRIVAEGGKVCLWDLNADALAAAKKEIGAHHTIALDISDAERVEAAAAEAKQVLGKIDILVNSAGITGATHTVIDYPIESWLKVFDVNVNGLFYCCRAIAKTMVEAGYGRIVNISYYARLRTEGGLYDQVLAISHVFHCIEPRLSFSARRSEIFLEFRIPGLIGLNRSGIGEPRAQDTRDETRPATRRPVQTQPEQ